MERYVLPKFKVAVEFAKTAHGYRPGDHVTGTVRANYFFGKPVDLAEVTVKASGMDVERFEAGQVSGKTDADGAYRFDLRLPSYFAGRALTQGVARVLIEATVKDSAGHAETRGEPVTVSDSPLLITAVPEGGTMAPHLENQVFLLTSYADGAPAVADVTVHAQGNADQKVKTDAGGVAVVRVKDAGSLRVEASDAEGNRLATTVPLELRQGEDQVLLRAERAVYRAGDAHAAAHLFDEAGRVGVRGYREGGADRADARSGPGERAGGADGDGDAGSGGDAGLQRLRVRPGRRDGGRPQAAVRAAGGRAQGGDGGGVARVISQARMRAIRFRVTNSRGQGVQAALGVQVVDEAVFALAEKQPGFAKVFFYLEQEAMKPRYEIHSIGMPEAVGAPGVVRRDLAAQALFAATEMNAGNRFETEVGRAVPMAKAAEYAARYREALVRKVAGFAR